MIDRLYVARGDKTFGPFSAVQLRGLAATGRLRLTDTVWRYGAMEKSVFAALVKNLFPPPPVVSSESSPAPSEAPGELGEPGPAAAARKDSAPPDSTAALSAIDPTSPGGTVPKEKAPRSLPEPVRKRRAVALKGAVILSQDGATVYYRKKCSVCSFEDRCRSSMPIGNGMTRAHFYCPQCRKGRERPNPGDHAIVGGGQSGRPTGGEETIP